tara:strand:+ start:4051 stop:5508 length:1458 start_codon:yes stop_codon:yes gene_type:complete
MDTIRQKTDLEDSYGKVKKIHPLLICNQNNKPRLPNQVLGSSVLLRDANIDLGECYSLTSRNYNDTLYERNLPFGKKNTYWDNTPSPSPSASMGNNISGNNISNTPSYSNNNLPLKIEPRPVLSGLCINEKAIKERDMLDKMNEYIPNNGGECNNTVFVPGKGNVNHYFDNIDIESQLKNINEVDTKCSAQLFKVNPNDNNNLSCYKDTIVKDYQKCEAKAGYTWCDYNNGVNYEQFPICKSKDFTCAMSQGSRNGKKINPYEMDNDLNPFTTPPSMSPPSMSTPSPSEVVVNNMLNDRLQSGEMVNEETLNKVTKELYLVQRKRELDTQIQMRRNDPKFSVNNQNITQYKGNGINNIVAPTIIKQEVDEDMAKLLGERSYIEGILEKITREGLNANTNVNGTNVNGTNGNPHNNILQQKDPNCLDPIAESNLAKSLCRRQTKNLYRFNNLVGDPTDDCYYCEQLFNNFTKRKTIVPNDPRFNSN